MCASHVWVKAVNNRVGWWLKSNIRGQRNIMLCDVVNDTNLFVVAEKTGEFFSELRGT